MFRSRSHPSRWTPWRRVAVRRGVRILRWLHLDTYDAGYRAGQTWDWYRTGEPTSPGLLRRRWRQGFVWAIWMRGEQAGRHSLPNGGPLQRPPYPLSAGLKAAWMAGFQAGQDWFYDQWLIGYTATPAATKHSALVAVPHLVTDDPHLYWQ